MKKLAWELEKEYRNLAIPFDRRIHESNWYNFDTEFPTGDELIRKFWFSNVPGSGAPEIPYQEMAQAQYNKGYDTSAATPLIIEGIKLAKENRMDDLRVLTAELLETIIHAPVDPGHPFHQYIHPETWQDIQAQMGQVQTGRLINEIDNLDEKILQGWLGQLAGGSFGTAIEGYTGEQIYKVYGDVRAYITEPETTNDDVTFELVFLDVFERMGRKITSRDIGLEWVKQIPFGWSAEWIALRNLNMGIFPPESGSFQNPYSNWIGAQMRGMIFGMLAPAWPMEAARLAHLDGVVSHDNNGVYGEIFAAVLTSLAFIRQNTRELLEEASEYIPQHSQYAAVVRDTLKTAANHSDPADAWKILEKRYEQFNWIDAHNNISAVIHSLWFGQGDMTESFAYLARVRYGC